MSLPPLHQASAETAERQHRIHPTSHHSTAQQKATLTKVHPQVSWGDQHTFPSTTHLCIVFQNCNTLSKDHFTRFSYLNRLKLLEPHIFGLAKTNLNWSHFPHQNFSLLLPKGSLASTQSNHLTFGGRILKLPFYSGRRVPPADLRMHQQLGPGIIL